MILFTILDTKVYKDQRTILLQVKKMEFDMEVEELEDISPKHPICSMDFIFMNLGA